MKVKPYNRLLIIIAMSTILVIAGVVSLGHKKSAMTNVAVGRPVAVPGEVNVTADFNPQLFYSALELYPKKSAAAGKQPAGGIISHHDLASNLIAEFFSRLSTEADIDTFVIVGPNHANVGAPVISGRVRWQTSNGIVANDYDFLGKLKESNLVSYDEENFARDHAIKTLVPFIRQYFPDAKIVPLLFTSEATMKRGGLLAGKVKELSSDRTFVLASLDFSHYLHVERAEEKDKITLACIQKRDYYAIAGFDNDYVDSPGALIALMRTMEAEGADDLQIVGHANSGAFPGGDRDNTTSYFSLLYYRPAK